MPATVSLVVLPGLDGTSHFLAPFCSCLPASIQPIGLDYPPNIHLDPGQLQDWVRERIPERDDVVLLAQSYSTPIALEVARTRPRLRGLVLVTSLLHRRPPVPVIAALRWTPRLLFRVRPPRFILRWLLLQRDAPEALLEQCQAVLREVQSDVLAARLRSVPELLAVPLEPLPGCPMLCLHAAQDRLLTSRYPPDKFGSGARVRHVTIPGPHLLLPCCPAAVAEQLTRFLAESC